MHKNNTAEQVEDTRRFAERDLLNQMVAQVDALRLVSLALCADEYFDVENSRILRSSLHDTVHALEKIVDDLPKMMEARHG